jgi:hypothetical protein
MIGGFIKREYVTEAAVGRKGPDDQLDQWAITIRYEEENSG